MEFIGVYAGVKVKPHLLHCGGGWEIPRNLHGIYTPSGWGFSRPKMANLKVPKGVTNYAGVCLETQISKSPHISVEGFILTSV